MLEFLAKVQGYAAYAKKALIGATTALAEIAVFLPATWSDEVTSVQVIGGLVIAVLGTVAQYRAENDYGARW